MEAEHESEAAAVAVAELHITEASSTENPTTDEREEVVSEEQKETVLVDEEEPDIMGNSASEEITSTAQLTCLTVQPNRVLCGVRLK